jgi:hypothetical protein
MRPPQRPHVETCAHCGHPAERPVVASGRVAGQDQEHVPPCVDCFELLLENARAFWDGMRRGAGPPAG